MQAAERPWSGPSGYSQLIDRRSPSCWLKGDSLSRALLVLFLPWPRSPFSGRREPCYIILALLLRASRASRAAAPQQITGSAASLALTVARLVWDPSRCKDEDACSSRATAARKSKHGRPATSTIIESIDFGRTQGCHVSVGYSRLHHQKHLLVVPHRIETSRSRPGEAAKNMVSGLPVPLQYKCSEEGIKKRRCQMTRSR